MAVPSRLGLLELLKGTVGSQYVIPAYQRNYTWTANHEVKQFLDDVKAVLRGERNKHFIGIMIYLEKNISALKSERSVIDGQQRLTTTFLTLYAIYEIMIERGMSTEAQQLESIYLINQVSDNQKFKLKPMVSDDLVYQKIVNHDLVSCDAQDKQTNVYKNFCYIKQILLDTLGYFSIDEILQALNKLYLVCVPIESDDYPQQIFESINATGAKLTASDLIRNYILMPIESEKQDAYYEKYWRKIEKLVSQDSRKLEAFFRFFLMAKLRQVVNKNAVYRCFISWYEQQERELGDEKILQGIIEYATYYNILCLSDISEIEKSLQIPIKEFRQIQSDMPIPLLLELFHIHSLAANSGLAIIVTKQHIAEIITVLNSYLMRRALAGMDTSDISRYFPTLLKDVLSDSDGVGVDIVEVFKKNLVNRNKGNSQCMPDDKQLADRVRNANMYNLRWWLMLFFRKLESNNNSAPVDFSALSVEHLMPQTPTDEWLSALAVDKDIYDQNLHRLGNLTLATRSDNSKMKNNIWEYKNEVLKKTGHLCMNLPLLSLDKWTIADIDKRTEELILQMCELYPYFSASNVEIEALPIYIQEDDADAQAIYYPDNGNVEILKGSILSQKYGDSAGYPEWDQWRQQLLDEGVIELQEGKLVFVEDYTCTSKKKGTTALSTAASIILQVNHNGWEWWKLENGMIIDTIRKK